MLPSSLIIEYLNSKFPDNRVFGAEFTIDSIFTPDNKKHLSINTDTGLWQDFKTHESGNFPQLVAAVEGISHDAALKFLRGKLFDTPEALFEISSIRVEAQKPSSENSVQDIFKAFRKFDYTNINEDTLYERLAKKFVIKRGLQKVALYICSTGRYANRIIIPYFYKGEDPFYFQARNLSVMGVKYLNPSREFSGVKSSDVLYPFTAEADYIFLTEGPLDAISLQLNGLNATCTQGSNLSHAQADQIKDKQVIFAYDNDDAGRAGIKQARKLLLGKNKNEFCVATLPEGVKDWNDLHVRSHTRDDFRSFVAKGLKEMDFEFEVTEALD